MGAGARAAAGERARAGGGVLTPAVAVFAPDDRTPRDTGPPAAPTVRAARPRDLPAVAAIEQASYGDPWSAGAFANLVDNPAVLFVVADNGGAVAGYLVAWFAADEAEIGNLAVSAAARGRGLGARLLDVAIAEVARRGAATVYLEVRESNAVARRLYTSRRFTEVGRRPRYYRHPVEDALVLALPLALAGPRNETAHRA